ncbi:MAG TPA: hypothetical protein VOA41_13050 [Candidatus Dormibacteraeota bacterium]|nr:hypothetical protein [Candidatus Dormibacteraeota bacterium]
MTKIGVPLLIACIAFGTAGCAGFRSADVRPLDQSGMWYEKIEELKALKVSDAEVAELTKLKQGGLTDSTCMELISLARVQKQPFSDADAILQLHRAGVTEPHILDLARLKQIPSWTGEAVTLRLTGLSDEVVLAVARRRASNLPVLSGPVIARLKNAQVTQSQILQYITGGMTDQQAERDITVRQYALAPHGFSRIHGRRHR